MSVSGQKRIFCATAMLSFYKDKFLRLGYWEWSEKHCAFFLHLNRRDTENLQRMGVEENFAVYSFPEVGEKFKYN